MRLLAPTHVDPSKKNKLVNYVETIQANLKEKADSELYWFAYQPDPVKTGNTRIVNIHDFDNAVELLQKIKPDCVFANNNSREPISYSLSIAAKHLNIPLVFYYLNDLDPVTGDQPDMTFSKNASILLRNFFSNRVATDTQSDASKMRRGKFFAHKNMFLFKTRRIVGTSYMKSLKLSINDLSLYFRYKKPVWNKLADLNLCSNDDHYKFLIRMGIDENKISATGSPFWDKIYEKIKKRKENHKAKRNGIRVLIMTSALVEHGFWTIQQRNTYLKEIFSELGKLENVSFDLKIHPASEDVASYEKILDEQNIKSKIYKKESMWEIIDDYDLTLSYNFSSVHTECAYGGVKMILLDIGWNVKKSALVDEAISSGFVKECKKFEDIGKHVTELADAEIQFNDELFEARERLAYKFDGKAGERAADAIIKLCRGSADC